MGKAYEINKKRMIIYLLIFILVSTIVTYLSIESTMKYKIALEQYDDNVKNRSMNFDTVNILERMNYNRDNQRYSIRLMMTIIICGIELLILYIYFLRNTKMVVDGEGIKVYGLYKRKAISIYTWDSMDYIKFQFPEGIRGLTTGYGIKIHMIKGKENDPEAFIPIERFLNYNDITQDIIKNHPNVKTYVQQDIQKESSSFIKALKEAYLEYKNNFTSYMAYSIIIFIFALLSAIFNKPPINLITAVASIYFGYRAKIAMNYRAYMSYRGEQIDFDEGWNYAKGKIGRYFGAEVIIGIITSIFIGVGAWILLSGLGGNYKILIAIVLGIVCLFSISRIYLIPYIASIIDTDKSYMSLNGMVIKKYYKKVLLIFSFLSLQFIPIIIIGAIHYKDIYTMNDLFSKVTYVNVVLGLFVSPYISSFIMSFLKELPVSSGGSDDE